MGLGTELNQHHQKEGRQTENQAKSPNNGINKQQLCRQRKQLIKNENSPKLKKKSIGRSDQKQEVSNEYRKGSSQYFAKNVGKSDQKQEVSNEYHKGSSQYFAKNVGRSDQKQQVSNEYRKDSSQYFAKYFRVDEEGKYDKEKEKESEKERDDTVQDEHLVQENLMVIKNKDQKKIPVKHVDENISSKISLKQKKDQENLNQIQKNWKHQDQNNSRKDAGCENKSKIGDNLQNKEIDNKDAYDSVTNPEQCSVEEETFVKMLSGGDENEDDNSIEKSYWETDDTSRCDSMDSLRYKAKLSVIAGLCCTTLPRVASHAVNQKGLSMLSDFHEKEMTPVVTEAMADFCRMEGDYTEVFEVSGLLSCELSNIPLNAKLEKSFENNVSQMAYGYPKEEFMEKHEVDALENEKEQFTEQPQLMIQVEEMKSCVSELENRMEKSPIHTLGLSDGSQHYNHNDSGRGHSTNGTSQSGSPSDNRASGGGRQGSDRGKNKKDDSKRDDHSSGKNNDNSEVNSPTVQILDARVPPLDFKTYRRKHGSLSIHELTMYLGYLGNLHVPLQEEAPPWQLHLEVNSCLEVVVDNFDPILDEALSCQICVTLSSHLKHFADCLLPYTSSCLICRQIFMFICVHVKTCIDKTAYLHQQKEQQQQQLAQICTVSLCKKITSFVSGDVDKLYRTLSHIWPRVKKALAGLLRSEEIWDSAEFQFPAKIPLGSRLSGKISTLPSIPEHESLPSSSSSASFTSKTSKQVLALSREGEEHDEGEPDHSHDHTSPVVDPNLVLGTAGIGISSLEQPQISVSDSSSSIKIYNDDAPSSLPDERFQPNRGQLYSLTDRPTGIPGIGEVVYGNNWQLLKVAKIWGNLKGQYQKEGRLALHYREEGVILSEYKKQLQIMKTRYQENFQYEKLVHLGNGMSGKCHLAQDWNTEYKFCLKKIHISHYEEKEIEIWSELEYPYIVKLYGAIRLGEMVFILAEFIDGGCLTEAINTQRNLNCRLSHRLALHYFKQLLQVLSYLRQKNILHEDLKADNILLSQDDRSIRVADFGLARRITHQKKGEQPFGTQTQWSPEKAGSKGHGFPSEVWAAVCVLVHMLSGHPPWVRRFPDAKLLHFVIVENSPPIQDIPKNVHPVVQDLIVQGLELDPGKRPTPDALLQHKAFTLFESGPPSDQIYSTLMTSSGAAMLPLNHLDENISILQEIYHSLAIPSMSQGVNQNGNSQATLSVSQGLNPNGNSLATPSVSQGVNPNGNSLATPSVSQGVNPIGNSLATPSVSQGVNLNLNSLAIHSVFHGSDVKESSEYKNSIFNISSQPQSSTSQIGGPAYELQSAELSGHLEWLRVLYPTPQVSPDLVTMPVLVNPDQGPFHPPSSHFYNYLYDNITPQLPVNTELQVYTPDDVSYSGSSYPSYNLSDDENSNLPNFSLLDVDRTLENLKQEMGLQESGSLSSSVARHMERAEIPDHEQDHQHDNVDSFELFGEGRQTLPNFGDLASFCPGEMFMLTDTRQPDQQLPCTECALPEFNEKTNSEERAVSQKVKPGSAKKQEKKLLTNLSPSAEQQESSQNSCSRSDVRPKDQQSCMTRHFSQPLIQTTEHLHPPTQPRTAPPDQTPYNPFPEFAASPRNLSSHQQLQTQSSQKRIDQEKALLETVDSQKASTFQNITSFNPKNSSSARLPSEKSEKDLRNELLKQAASDRDKTSSSKRNLHVDVTIPRKDTHSKPDNRAPNTAPATSSRENREPYEDVMWKSCDEMHTDPFYNTQSTPSPSQGTPKSAYDKQEEEFRKLETESQQSDEITYPALDDYDDETNEQAFAELASEHDDDDGSLQYVVNTYLDRHDQSTECSLSLTFLNSRMETILEMRVNRQTTQSWQDFIDREFCQNNSYHDLFGLEMFNFQRADGTLVNLDDNIGNDDRTVLVKQATVHDTWFIENGIIRHSI